MLNPLDDTIAAISTPPGEGGIGIVRLSGTKSIEIAARLFRSSSKVDFAVTRRRVFHGDVVDSDGRVVDEALLHVMRAPHSYTREDVVEINCHGGFGCVGAVLEQTLIQGARLAEPGEFTRRAFLNGRIDLVQAEAVIDRIQAKTKAGLRAAASAASGMLSRSLNEMKARLVNALAHVEAAVDFPEEDLPDLVNAELLGQLNDVLFGMRALLDTADRGRLYREGLSMAIAGRPNVGKSSLFNALLCDARAIVSAQPGTTRDRIEEFLTLGGAPVRLVDTAGVRVAHDEVERIGVEIARKALACADVILFVLDGSMALTDEDRALAVDLSGLDRPVWLVLNKRDVASIVEPPDEWLGWLKGVNRISAKDGAGLVELENALSGFIVGGGGVSPEDGLITRAHQHDSLRRAAASVERALANSNASPEFMSIDLRDALSALGEITGETTPEDVLDLIFSSFCVGK
jgi:tRNA modification GTPase